MPSSRSPKQPSRPTAVDVGYTTFTISYLTDDEWKAKDHPDGDGGRTLGASGEIFIRVQDNLIEDHVREVLVHELLHVCVYISNLAFEDHRVLLEIEETFVRRMSPHLLEMLRRNPGLAAYLTAP